MLACLFNHVFYNLDLASFTVTVHLFEYNFDRSAPNVKTIMKQVKAEKVLYERMANKRGVRTDPCGTPNTSETSLFINIRDS